jgi:hypothetical protein
MYLFHILNQQNALNKFNKTDHKIHLLSGANSYTFQHQGALYGEIVYNKVS